MPWKGSQDVVVLHFRPCRRDDEALAEDADGLGSLHAALDFQDRAGAWELQRAEALVREGILDLHHTLALISCHDYFCAGPAQAEPLGP